MIFILWNAKQLRDQVDHATIVIVCQRASLASSIKFRLNTRFGRWDTKEPGTVILSFLYVEFLSQKFTNRRAAGEGGWHFINSSLPLSLASQTLRHSLSDYCRKLTSTHSQNPDSNRESLLSERKSLTTKRGALKNSTYDRAQHTIKPKTLEKLKGAFDGSTIWKTSAVGGFLHWRE